MARRILDLILTITLGLVAAPFIACGAIAVRLSSPGPAFYCARRTGRNGAEFTMYKLRSMHIRSSAGSSITAANDSRVFAAGKILRALKIDELPQLWNILRGDMSIVGPRPEAPDIVQKYYTSEYLRSLQVAPGLTSPGSVFYYTHGEQLLPDGAAEEVYAERLLPLKMKVDLEYLVRQTVWTDLAVMFTTASVLVQKALGRRSFPLPGILAEPNAKSDPKALTSQNSGHRSAA